MRMYEQESPVSDLWLQYKEAYNNKYVLLQYNKMIQTHYQLIPLGNTKKKTEK